MVLALRFLVLQILLLWQGGFLFYTAIVVPTGTKLFGGAGQGAITARATDALNAIGAVGLAALALELSRTRDPNRRRTRCRWWAWGVALVCHGLLIYFHMLLDAFMEDQRRVVIAAPFYPVHRMYLWASTVQWFACLLLTWWALRAWKAEDEIRINHRVTEGTEKDAGKEKN